MGALKSKRCSQGHLMEGSNLIYRANGQRECRKCSRDRAKKWRDGKKAPK